MGLLVSIAALSHQILACCILLSLFVGSVVYEAMATRPDRQWWALISGVLTGIVMFLLLVWLLG